MPKIETGMRARIAKFLPHALETAILSYHEFSEEQATTPEEETDQSKNDKAKSFRAHHDACKIAIAHIELLIKLAQWADLPDPTLEDEMQAQTLRGLIESAQAELSGKE